MLECYDKCVFPHFRGMKKINNFMEEDSVSRIIIQIREKLN